MHRRATLFYAAHLVVLTFAAFLWATRAEAGICIDIDLHVGVQQVSRDLPAALKREATAIWAPYGVDLRWSPHECAVEDASFEVWIDAHVSVVDRQASGTILGSTRVQQARIDRVPISVDYDAMEKTLGSLTSAQITPFFGSRIGPDEMGRACGRVVAHEIGHVLLGLSRHEQSGLMRQSFAAAELVQLGRRPYRLSSEDVGRLRQRSTIMSHLERVPPAIETADIAEATGD
jgi:hypothetical protein